MTSIIPQLIFTKMEHRYPQHTFVAVKKEPRILYWVKISHDVQFACRRIALGTHNGDFFAVASHVNHNQGMPHSLQFAGWIDEHITGLHLTYRAWRRFTTYRESTAHTVGSLQEFLQCFVRGSAMILQCISIYITETYLRVTSSAEQILSP